MKRFLTLLLMALLVVGVADAQNDMRKRFEERRARQRERYEQKRSEQQKKHDEFRRKQNERYVEQLRKRWKQYEATEAVEEKPKKDPTKLKQYQAEILSPELDTKAFGDITLDVTTPLPTKNDTIAVITIDTVLVIDSIEDLERFVEEIRSQIPAVKMDTIQFVEDTTVIEQVDTTNIEVKIQDVLYIPKPEPQPQPMAPIEPLEEDKDFVSIALYGTLVSVAFPQDADLHLQKVDEYGIATLWEQIADTVVPSKFDVTISSCLQHRTEMQLCDWAYMRLVRAISEKRYGDTNEAVIFASYIMAQSGYKIRLAFKEDHVFMLFASQHEIYGMKKVILEDECYFILDSRLNGSFYVSEVGYEKEQRFSLLIADEQKVDTELSDTLVATSAKGCSLSYQVNVNMIQFYDDYPSGRLFFGDESSKWLLGVKTPLDSITKSTLYPHVQEAVKDLSPWQAVAKLLNWVQTGFEYGFDDDVWGHDRVFFPAETLYYPNSDCEDKAILFTTLVRDILNLDVVLLYFDDPEHLATAVHIPVVEKPGEYIVFNDKQYMVCDPTLKNGPIGVKMSYYKGIDPKVIVID